MPIYDADGFDPPAPVADSALRNPETGATVKGVSLLVDTGADVTLLPRGFVEEIGIPVLVDQRYELMGFDGSTSFAEVVVLDLLFLRRAFRGKYLLPENQRGILGRDVLNHLVLLIDGPQQRWSEAGQLS